MNNEQKPDRHLLSNLPTIDPTADFTDKVMAQVSAEAQGFNTSRHSGSFVWWVSGIAAACAALVLVVVFTQDPGEQAVPSLSWMQRTIGADLEWRLLFNYPLFALGAAAIGGLLFLEQLFKRFIRAGEAPA